MSKYTDAPDVFHSAIASNVLAAALTRWRYRCLLGGSTKPRWPNFWTFLVGDSAESRKSTCVDMGLEVISRAMEEILLPKDCSPEGFARAYVKRVGSDTQSDAAGLLVHSELGLFLMSLQKEYMQSMKYMMMDFYDSPPTFSRQLSQQEFTVRRPRFSLFGGIALELLPVMTSTEDWLGGFMNRAFIIYAQRTRTMERAMTVPDSAYDDLAKKLHATLRVWRTTRMTMSKKMKDAGDGTFLFNYDDDGLKAAKTLKKAMRHSIDDNVRILHGRSDQHLITLAAVEQVSMDPESPVITKRAVECAAPLFTHWWNHAPEVLEMAFARSNKDTEGDRLARRALRLIRNKPNGYPERELMKSTVLDWEHFERAIRSLEFSGIIERVDAGDGTGPVLRVKKEG